MLRMNHPFTKGLVMGWKGFKMLFGILLESAGTFHKSRLLPLHILTAKTTWPVVDDVYMLPCRPSQANFFWNYVISH